MPSRREFLVSVAQAGAALSALRLAHPSALWAGPESPDLPVGLDWRMLGPFRGGRCAAASGVTGRPDEFYFGHVNGGVWKTKDAGRTWLPVFDDQPIASIGALAVAPSAPDVIYVGTGESTLRDSTGFGNGVYKSTDAGSTWTHLGLSETQHIGKIAVDPKNPDVFFVAAIGHLYAANPDRGLFRSRDGGRTWQKVLYMDENVGAVEVVIDPTDARVVYAGLWNTRRPPWFTYAPTNGPGGGIHKSTDGGTTWRPLTAGLPAAGIGRTGIAVAPSNPRRVYAVVDCLVPDPNAPDLLIVASDQGTIITRNARTADPRAMTWSSWLNQPTAQIYHASVDYRFPYWVVGAQQDSGAVAVRARGKFAQISQRDWEPIGAAGESGYAMGDPLHPGIIYGGDGSRWDLETNLSVPSTTAPKGTETDRGDWTQPLVLSPADPHPPFYASQFVFNTTDGARTWKHISA